MAVHFLCSEPQKLLDAFDGRIEQATPKGKITTWEKSSDGQFYTHRAPAWSRKAWFRPEVDAAGGKLSFLIIKPKNAAISTVAYAYYHGHLIETFLAHFDGMFSTSRASALPLPGDKVA